MTCIPLLTIRPAKANGAQYTFVGHRDFSALTVSKDRNEAAGSWSITPSTSMRKFLREIVMEDDFVTIERSYPGEPGKSNDTLMLGLTGNPQLSDAKDPKGVVTQSESLDGQDLTKLFLRTQNVYPAYLQMGDKKLVDYRTAFEKYHLFGQTAFQELGTYGDPGHIIDAIINVLLLGGGSFPDTGKTAARQYSWGIDAKLSDGTRLADLLDLRAIQRFKTADPGILWAWQQADPQTMFGCVWTAMERYIDKSFMDLYTDTVETPDGPKFRITLRPLPYWSHDRQQDWISLPTIREKLTGAGATHGISAALCPSPNERFNYYAMIPVGMFGTEASAAAFYNINSAYPVTYPETLGGSFNISLPLEDFDRYPDSHPPKLHKIRHGRRPWEPRVQAVPLQLQTKPPLKSADALIREAVVNLTCRGWDWFFAQDESYNGHVTLMGYPERIHVGTRIIDEVDQREYHIEHVTDTWTASAGWSTRLNVSRGISAMNYFSLLERRNALYKEGHGG